MPKTRRKSKPAAAPTGTQEGIARLRSSIEGGMDWPAALLESMAVWSDAREIYDGRELSYFIGGEAFDWLLLAERLCDAVDGLIPDDEKEQLLFSGRFPSTFDQTRFKDLLGVEKYRGYLNYFYGVTVEEALQLAAEREVQKRHLSNGNTYRDDFSDEAFERIYRAPKTSLLVAFRDERGYAPGEAMELTEAKEFTYWLFKYRLMTSDKAKIASDTKKGLRQLQQMEESSRSKVRLHIGD